MTAALLPPLARIPADVVAVADYEGLARDRLTPQAWAYFSGGASDECSLRDNCAAFDRVRLQTRVLRALAGGSTRLELFGQTFEHPILLAPVAHQALAHPEGERASLLGAAALGAGAVISTQASVRLEELAGQTHGPLWFQLYLQPERADTETLVRRAEAAGCQALVLTVDAPVNGLRHREWRAGFSLPPQVRAVNLDGMRPLPPQIVRPGQGGLFAGPLLDLAATWGDVEWLRGLTRLPVLLKGVLSAADAALALAHGVQGLIVSNHGGRTLDGVPATIDALPAVAAAVGGRVPVLLDGGVRRGTDILKALARGATAVLVGRPYVYALAAAGAPGVAHVLHLLRTELETAMVLTGCRELRDIDASVLWMP